MIPALTEKILGAKKAKGLSFTDLATAVGCSPVFLAAVCYRQASATPEQAGKLVEILELEPACASDLSSFPTKGGLIPTVPADPLLYRLHEILQVYGMPLKDVIQETFGDGIIRLSTSRSMLRKRKIPGEIGSGSSCRANFCLTNDGKAIGSRPGVARELPLLTSGSIRVSSDAGCRAIPSR